MEMKMKNIKEQLSTQYGITNHIEGVVYRKNGNGHVQVYAHSTRIKVEDGVYVEMWGGKPCSDKIYTVKDVLFLLNNGKKPKSGKLELLNEQSIEIQLEFLHLMALVSLDKQNAVYTRLSISDLVLSASEMVQFEKVIKTLTDEDGNHFQDLEFYTVGYELENGDELLDV